MASRKPIIFFSPGGYHSPWVFDNVSAALKERGFEATATSLVSVGAPDANIGLQDDVDHVRPQLVKLIDEGKEIILVGHSYGGLVVTNVAEGLGVKQRAAQGKTGGILMIIYMAALVLPAGTNISANYSPEAGWDKADGKFKNFINPPEPYTSFYHDVEPSLAKKAVDSLQPVPERLLLDLSTYEPWNEGFNVGYIFTEEDKILPLSKQKEMASVLPEGSFTASLPSSHSPFLSMTDALADIIRDAAEHVLKKESSV
ncbi:Alpha/beta hydrolase fold-1 [Nemania sp. FL0916]|nr:Alpha/beta hydrolase fold-1 [Nemania sp. FL0916]